MTPRSAMRPTGRTTPTRAGWTTSCVGKDADFSINIITTDHPNHGDLYTLAAQNTGKAELLVVLPDDTRVIDDARLYLKTSKYIQQNTGAEHRRNEAGDPDRARPAEQPAPHRASGSAARSSWARPRSS